MATELPEPLQWVLLLLAGCRWPEADEDQLRDMAEHCRKTAEGLKDASRGADSAIKRALDGQQGNAAQSLGAYWVKFSVGKGTENEPGRLGGAVNALNGMGDMLEQMANSAETAKIQIVVQLGILAFEIATAEAESVVTAGASMLQVPVMIQTQRQIVLGILKKLATEMITMAAKQAIQMAAINLLAQGIELAEGHRKSIDMKEVGQNALGGAIGGATGHLLGAGIGGIGKKLGAEAALGSTVGKMATGAAVGVGADALTQLITTGEVDTSSLLGSGLSGGAGVGLHAAGAAAKAHANAPKPGEGPHLDIPGPTAPGTGGRQDGPPPSFTKPDSAPTGESSYHGPEGNSSTATGTASGTGTGSESKPNGLTPFGSGRTSDAPPPSYAEATSGAGRHETPPSSTESPSGAGRHDAPTEPGRHEAPPSYAEATGRQEAPPSRLETAGGSGRHEAPPSYAEATGRHEAPPVHPETTGSTGGHDAPTGSGRTADAPLPHETTGSHAGTSGAHEPSPQPAASVRPAAQPVHEANAGHGGPQEQPSRPSPAEVRQESVPFRESGADAPQAGAAHTSGAVPGGGTGSVPNLAGATHIDGGSRLAGAGATAVRPTPSDGASTAGQPVGAGDQVPPAGTGTQQAPVQMPMTGGFGAAPAGGGAHSGGGSTGGHQPSRPAASGPVTPGPVRPSGATERPTGGTIRTDAERPARPETAAPDRPSTEPTDRPSTEPTEHAPTEPNEHTEHTDSAPKPETVRPADADRLRQELPGMSAHERAQELANLTPENRRWLARDPRTVDALRNGLPPHEFARTASELLVHVDPRAERAASARQEAQQQVARMLQDPDTAARLLKSGADVVIVPKDVRMTDVPSLHELRTVRNDSDAAAGRAYDDMRGSGGRHAAVTEENLLGEDTSIGHGGHYEDGYSTTTHEFSHTLHRHGLDEAGQKLITETFRKKDGDPDAVWPDGPGRGANGEKNYSSRDEQEYFAQLTNAYLGTNHGTDPYTGEPRNNGVDWVRHNEPEMLPLLEKLYGPAPDRQGGANPVHATAAENDMYAGLREFTDLVEGNHDTPEPQPHEQPQPHARLDEAPPPRATDGELPAPPPEPSRPRPKIEPLDKPPTPDELAYMHAHPSGVAMVIPPTKNAFELGVNRMANKFRPTPERLELFNSILPEKDPKHGNSSTEIGSNNKPEVRYSEKDHALKVQQDPATFMAVYGSVANHVNPLVKEHLPPGDVANNRILEEGSRLDYRTKDHHAQQDVRRNILERLAHQDAQADWHPVPEDEVAGRLAGSPSALDGAQRLLADHEGIVLGESHNHSATWGFLTGNMEHLKNAGVDTIYLEALKDEAAQPLLDEYLKSPAGTAMPDKLRRLVASYDNHYNAGSSGTLRGLLESAKGQGVDVRAVDGYPATADTQKSTQEQEARARRFNSYARHIIDTNGNPGKYVLVTGMAHVHDHAVTGGAPIRGTADMLGVPGVKLTGPDGNLATSETKSGGLRLSPVHDAPANGDAVQPVHQDAVQPANEQPVHEQPANEQPVHEQPANEQPVQQDVQPVQQAPGDLPSSPPPPPPGSRPASPPPPPPPVHPKLTEVGTFSGSQDPRANQELGDRMTALQVHTEQVYAQIQENLGKLGLGEDGPTGTLQYNLWSGPEKSASDPKLGPAYGNDPARTGEGQAAAAPGYLMSSTPEHFRALDEIKQGYPDGKIPSDPPYQKDFTDWLRQQEGQGLPYDPKAAQQKFHELWRAAGNHEGTALLPDGSIAVGEHGARFQNAWDRASDEVALHATLSMSGVRSFGLDEANLATGQGTAHPNPMGTVQVRQEIPMVRRTADELAGSLHENVQARRDIAAAAGDPALREDLAGLADRADQGIRKFKEGADLLDPANPAAERARSADTMIAGRNEFLGAVGEFDQRLNGLGLPAATDHGAAPRTSPESSPEHPQEQPRNDDRGTGPGNLPPSPPPPPSSRKHGRTPDPDQEPGSPAADSAPPAKSRRTEEYENDPAVIEGRGFRPFGPEHPLSQELVSYLGGEPKLHPPMSNSLLHKVNPHEAPVHEGQVHEGPGGRRTEDLNACLENVEAYRDTHFGRPRVSGQSLHGEVEHAGADALWKRHDAPARFGEGPEAVRKLMEQVQEGGPGSFATVIGAGKDGDGHAVALVHDRDGTLRWADLTDRKVTTADGALPTGFGEDWTLWASVADPHGKTLSGPHDPAFMDRFGTLNAHGTDPSDGIGVSHRNPPGNPVQGRFPKADEPPKPDKGLMARLPGTPEQKAYEAEKQERRRLARQWQQDADSLEFWMNHRGGRTTGTLVELGPAGAPHLSFDKATGEVVCRIEPGMLNSQYESVPTAVRDFIVHSLRSRGDGFAVDNQSAESVDFMRRYGASRPETQGYWEAQQQRDADLDTDADLLAGQGLPEQPGPAEVDGLLASAAGAQGQSQALLGEHQGFVLGENHGDQGTWDFLRGNMQQLRDSGVRTLYLEHFTDEAFQPMLDRYFATTPPGTAPGEELAAVARRQSKGMKLPEDAVLDTIVEAHRQGVEVRVIDGYPARRNREGIADVAGDEGKYFRARRMNAYAHEAIATHQGEAPPPAKYVVVVGTAHVSTHAGWDERPPVAGLAQTLGAPGVRFVREPVPDGLPGRTRVALPPRMEQVP
ncbi:toxin glutamine deamidase domain-containing protein [Kitasatospora cineracea]|uniref:WXG100-like domain-containing protein n=1 Tax=Kitasatospora cineracea TaxID=88074 RepID=UPI00340F2F25